MFKLKTDKDKIINTILINYKLKLQPLINK